MLTIVGHTFSRVIECLCKIDLKFIALTDSRQPHFTTIANFVSSNYCLLTTFWYGARTGNIKING
jgi:hypothetical protein